MAGAIDRLVLLTVSAKRQPISSGAKHVQYLSKITESRILASISLSSLVREMAWRQVGANPLLEPMMTSHREKAKEQS